MPEKKVLKARLPERFISISLVEDNAFIRGGWRALLSGVGDFLVLGDYDSCEAAFAAEDFLQSDVIIMDIGLPGMKGTEAVLHIIEHDPAINVIICSVHDDDANIFEAICNGAVGYLLKSTSPEEFCKSIYTAAGGGSPMSPSIARKVLASFRARPAKTHVPEALNPQELRVLNELAQGKSYREIGAALNLSIDGVRYHIRSIYRKLQVHSAPEAVSIALRQRLIR